jgi:hypothetical protein
VRRIESSVGRDLARWWFDILDRAGRVPSRSDFEPSMFKGQLPHIFLVDVLSGSLPISSPAFRFRLCGTYIVDALGGDATGKFIGPGTFGVRWRRIQALYEQVVISQGPVATHEVVAHPRGYLIGIEVVHLPLSRNARTVDQIIGTFCRRESRVNNQLISDRAELLWDIEERWPIVDDGEPLVVGKPPPSEGEGF